MKTLLKNATIMTNNGTTHADFLISNGSTFVFDPSMTQLDLDRVIDCSKWLLLPGFADVHVHFREPGFSYKETIRTGAQSAARGGYTAVCTMPNLNPVPSNLEALRVQLDAIEKDSCIRIYPYGTITELQDGRSKLSDMEALAPYVCAFTDDGRGVQAGELMEEAMLRAKDLGKLIVAHCEDESLLGGTSIHDGAYARSLGHKGISSASEWAQVERDCELAAKTGCGYHVCHVSTKESVEIIRQAKKSGVDVTCETGPHYLTMTDMELQDLGRFKMNPPIRTADDRDALIEGLLDGSVDMVATDHAPHSAEEKSKGILNSAFGVVGLETAFSVLYTKLVEEQKILTLDKLVDVMAIAPRKRFGLPGGSLEDGAIADLTAIDLNQEYTIDPAEFLSMGKASPFEGWNVLGRTKLTMVGGEIVFEDK